jgi:hypothetical protein
MVANGRWNLIGHLKVYIILNIACCFKFVRNISGKPDLLPSSHTGENILS